MEELFLSLNGFYSDLAAQVRQERIELANAIGKNKRRK